MLFNTAVFNSRVFNGGLNNNEVLSTDPAAFEGFSLSDGSRMVLTRPPTRFGPTREIEAGPVPRSDGMYQTAEPFRETTIELDGYVKHTTAALLDAYLDTIKESLWSPQGDLDIIDANSTVKRYVATVDNFDEMFQGRRREDVTRCPFHIRFKCLVPFGKARTYTSYLSATMTSTTIQNIVNTGNYKAKGVFIMIWSTTSNVTAVNLASSTTGESITYTGGAAIGDVLIFDGENSQVTKNGTAVAFTGAFPVLMTGSNLITTTVTCSSFLMDQTSKYRATYL